MLCFNIFFLFCFSFENESSFMEKNKYEMCVNREGSFDMDRGKTNHFFSVNHLTHPNLSFHTLIVRSSKFKVIRCMQFQENAPFVITIDFHRSKQFFGQLFAQQSVPRHSLKVFKIVINVYISTATSMFVASMAFHMNYILNTIYINKTKTYN